MIVPWEVEPYVDPIRPRGGKERHRILIDSVATGTSCTSLPMVGTVTGMIG